MMITAHSVLRDKYSRLSLFFENSLIISSVILNAFVFIDAGYITKMTGINEDIQKFILGISSVIVFAISVVLIQVKWKEKAETYDKAAAILAKLLHECRSIIHTEDGDAKNLAIIEFDKKYFSRNQSDWTFHHLISGRRY